MPHVKRSGRSRYSNKTGSGLVNSLINSLPFELHIPRYQYCGPGTNVRKRVARRMLSYLNNKDNLRARHQAD